MTHHQSALTTLISEVLTDPNLAHNDVFRRLLQAGLQDLIGGYRAAKTRPPSARNLRDDVVISYLTQLHARNYGVYGIRNMWHAARRTGLDVGRDQVARLMKKAGITGVRRGRKPITTRPADEPDT